MKDLTEVCLKILAVAALGVGVLVSCAKIDRRLDDEARAQHQYIQAYKQDLKDNQVKD